MATMVGPRYLGQTMVWQQEPASQEELKGWKRDFFWYYFADVSEARKDRKLGIAEVGEVEVRRAWTLIDCLGTGCCPNDWLLECQDSTYIKICSYRYLNKWDGVDHTQLFFPGSKLTIRRWPVSHRVIHVDFSGERLPIPEYSWDLDSTLDRLLSRAGIRDYVRCQEVPSGIIEGIEHLL